MLYNENEMKCVCVFQFVCARLVNEATIRVKKGSPIMFLSEKDLLGSR
jgi:hypothetical protein